jgi:uncharacterized membrane protein
MKIYLLYVMSAAYILAGLNHFRDPQFYLRMMPPYLPAHSLLVAASGVAEVILGLLLLWPAARPWAAWGIILLLLAIFPANFYMFQERNEIFREIPSWLLLARLPLQLGLIAWAYLYTRD